MEQELNYFFDLSGIGYIFYQFTLLHSDIEDIPTLLQLFHESNSIDMIWGLVKSVCKNRLPKEDTIEYKELENSIDQMLDLVEKTEFQDNRRRERVIESLKNPDETKQRLYYFMYQYYQRCFASIENKVISIVASQAEKYQNLFDSNPEKFMEQYLNLNPLEIAKPIICLSFFKYIGWHHYSTPSNGEADWFIMGIYSDLLFDENLNLERFSIFFKTLSDPNRIAILKLLSQKPWYGQELAEKLNITPATISYHMTFLQKVGVITFQKMDNRSYYCLNQNKLMELIEDFKDFFNDFN
jgi:DNA-binding transcriptional ArsR family regulator